MEKIKYLLQNDIPSNTWLVKDTNKEIIRSISNKIKDPANLTNEEELIMKKLIDFVRVSQDEVANHPDKKDHLRPAVGLAAPQIGHNIDMFYMRIEWPEEDNEEYAMINCKIIAQSEQIVAIEHGEGCLSVDEDHEGIVPRNYKIRIEGYDWLTKKHIKVGLRGYSSIVFQHEMDHNVGKLYYDWIDKEDPEFVGEDWMLI